MSVKIEAVNDESLAKFVQKAKKRLNKKIDEKEQNQTKRTKVDAEYVYIKSKRKDEEKAVAQKVKAMLTKNSFISNPIGELMDKDLVAKMTEEQRIRYVLKLSKIYNTIVNK